MRHKFFKCGIALGLLLLSSCHDAIEPIVDTRVGLWITFTGVELAAGGGYRVELREASGASIEGFEQKFIPYQEGEQRALLRLESEDLFSQQESVTKRLYVEAAPSQSAAATAIGSKIVTMEKDRQSEDSISLYAKPDLQDTDIQAWFSLNTDTNGDPALSAPYSIQDSLHLDWSAFTPEETFTYHLWQKNGDDLSWVQALAMDETKTAEIDLQTETSLLNQDDLEFVISAEPVDSGDALERSNGWQLFSGGLSLGDAHRDTLANALTFDETCSHLSCTLFSLMTMAENHRGFALASTSTASETAMHAEHVYNMVNGSNEEKDGNDEDGEGKNPFGNIIAIADGSAENLGYGAQIRTLAEDIVENGPSDGLSTARIDIYNELNQCATNLQNAAQDVLDAVENLIDDSTNEDLQNTFSTAVDALRGDTYSAAEIEANSTQQSARCILNRLAAMSLFALKAE